MTEANEFVESLWGRMPILRVGLGLCPALAVSTGLKTGIGMGVSVVFVLVVASLVGPVLARVLGRRFAVLCYLAVTGALVTLAGIAIARYDSELRAGLGIYLPLVAVNCLVLVRLDESVTPGILPSLSRALGAGLGFALAIAAVSAVREVLGAGMIWGHYVMGISLPPVSAAALAPGAFITVGLLAGLVTLLQNRKTGKTERS